MANIAEHIDLKDVRHIKLCGSKQTYCGHPRQCGIYNFGGGEIAVAHHHAPSRYDVAGDVKHNSPGVHARAVRLLQRSLDSGETWPQENNVVIFDESAPLEKRRNQVFGVPDKPRERMDMSQDGAIFNWVKSWVGPEDEAGIPKLIPFVLRSVDKGHTWEHTPTIVQHPFNRDMTLGADNHPVVQMPDGTFLAALSLSNAGVCLFATEDNGLTWEYISVIARTSEDLVGGGPTYAGLIRLATGRLLCFMLFKKGPMPCICMNYSDDGYNWTEPKAIVRWGDSPWSRIPIEKKRCVGGPQCMRNTLTFGDAVHFGKEKLAGMPWTCEGPECPRGDTYGPRDGVHYRSPWPMLLADGRLLVLFARRRIPYGIGCLFSEDDGASWSSQYVVRADGFSPDLGYPVATQLDDGRIFTAYYMSLEDGNKFGGSRFIGGSFFNLP